MALVYFYIFASIFLVSLVSFIGVFFLSISAERLKKITMALVSFSAGTMLGGAALHLLPESIEKFGSSHIVWLGFLAGVLVFFILEKVICWRHCHIPTSDNHPHPLGLMNLLGDGFHNFLDGIVIAGTFMIDIKLGIATSLAVIVHEIPQEIGDFGVLIHAGYSRKKALMMNFFIALTAVLGALLTIIIGTRIENFSDLIIPFTAGGFIYIASADLLPELKKDPHPIDSLKQLVSILLGILIMYLLV